MRVREEYTERCGVLGLESQSRECPSYKAPETD